MGQKPEWPTDCLSDLLRGKVDDAFVAPDDVQRVRVLMAFSESQIGSIRSTLELLRSFIAKNFSIDDLLYVQGKAAD